jgi:hypothetical protein
MTKTTDKRQLRLLIDGILSAYGVDNLELSIKLAEGVKRLIDADLPVKTREDYLQSIERTINKGQARHEQLAAIALEIETRVKIRPVTQDWQDFIEWVYKRQEHGESISQFIDWWLSDDWQRGHPPTRPDGWMVKWPQAFAKRTSPIQDESIVW